MSFHRNWAFLLAFIEVTLRLVVDLVEILPMQNVKTNNPMSLVYVASFSVLTFFCETATAPGVLQTRNMVFFVQ